MDRELGVTADFKSGVKRAIRFVLGDARSVALLNRVRHEPDETGGSSDGRYSYSVFCRHKVKLHEQLGLSHFPTVCEFGPGDAITIGLLHLSTGSNRLLAFDGQRYLDRKKTATAYREAIQLLRSRAEIPHHDLPSVFPKLDDYRFPEYIDGVTTPAELDVEAMLDEADRSAPDSRVQYAAPYDMHHSEHFDTVDLITSQAVLEHVKDMAGHYKFQHGLLKSGGVALHQIDFKAHGTSLLWNGHWGYSPSEYERVMKAYTFRWINRLPLGRHLALAEEAGFAVVDVERNIRRDGISRGEVSAEFADITDADLVTSSALVILRKK